MHTECQQINNPRKSYRLCRLGWQLAKFGTFLLAILTIQYPSTLAQTKFRTGAEFSRAFYSQPYDVNWLGLELRTQIVELCKSQQLAVWIDRRVDPELPIDLHIENASVNQILWLIAEKYDLAICRIGDIVYFGPKTTAACLPTAIADLEKRVQEDVEDRTARTQLSKNIAVRGDKFCQPGNLISKLVADCELSLTGSDQIPLDVWNEFELPPQNAVTTIALLCSGFDRWIDLDANGKLKVVPFEFQELLKRQYPDMEDAVKKAKSLKQTFANSKIAATGKSILVEANSDTINKIDRFLAFETELKTTIPTDRRYTLVTDASRGNLLATVARQMKLELEFDPELQQELDKVISINASNLKIEEILEKIVDESPLEYEIDAKKLKVKKKKD